VWQHHSARCVHTHHFSCVAMVVGEAYQTQRYHLTFLPNTLWYVCLLCVYVYLYIWMYGCMYACVCICAYASEWRRAWHDEVRCNDVAWCNQCSHAFPECHVFTLTYWFLAEVNLTYTQTPLESQSKKRRRENLVESLIQLIPCSNFQQQTGEKLRMQLVFFINMTDSAQ